MAPEMREMEIWTDKLITNMSPKIERRLYECLYTRWAFIEAYSKLCYLNKLKAIINFDRKIIQSNWNFIYKKDNSKLIILFKF